jgi:hypothetical protein
MSTRDDILASLAACRADLARVADDLKWAMEPGLSPEGRGLGAPRGVALRAVDQADNQLADPDFVPGPRWALDIGDPKLRDAFLKGVDYLALAELRLVFAVSAMRTEATQPKPARPDNASSFRLIDISRMGMERRLTIIERDLDLASTDAQRECGHHLYRTIKGNKPSAQQALDLAVRRLSSAFARGDVTALWEPDPDRDIPIDKRCVNCARRKKHKKWAPRCSPCGHWFKRKGEERPTWMDGIDPRDAAKKRRDRGEGWGVA